MKYTKPILSPYQDDIDRLSDEKSYFSLYDDLPASVSWLQTMGVALGKKFGITVVPVADQWEIDFPKKEMRVGSIEQVYTRRGVLGLLLNGLGRLAFGGNFPQTTKTAKTYATKNNVSPELAKHFAALARFVDEVRTDDTMAHEYAGGERVVSTMHAQAYEGANEQLRLMAMDMRVRREFAKTSIEKLTHLHSLVMQVGAIADTGDSSSPTLVSLRDAGQKLFESIHAEDKAMQTSLWQTHWMNNEVMNNIAIKPATGRIYAAWLIAMHPEDTDVIAKVLIRSYQRNVSVFSRFLGYEKVGADEEKEVIRVAGVIHNDLKEVDQLANHSGGHAQYVMAKAEQYYHGYTLGVPMQSQYYGFDPEAKFLEVQQANDSAREIALAQIEHGITSSVEESIEFAKELLPLIKEYPYLDLNDSTKNQDGGKGGGNGSMNQRVMGAHKAKKPRPKRDKQREKQSSGDRAKDRKKMENKNAKKNQEEVESKRGNSLLASKSIDPLSKYLYLISPYLPRISTAAARMRRFLKVNEPLGMRGAFRRGKELNPKVLYRHRADDFKLFSRKDIDKEINYGFVLMGDLSGSTEHRYTQNSKRTNQDEIMAAAFIVTEIAERIGEKVLSAVGFFSNEAQTVKRPGAYLRRSTIVDEITEFGGGTDVDQSGYCIEDDLKEMQEFKVKNKTVIFITDGCFSEHEFLNIVQSAKKYNASIAYFQIDDDVSGGIAMCNRVDKFVHQNAKGVRVRTRNFTTKEMSTLPDAIVQLMKETITAKS